MKSLFCGKWQDAGSGDVIEVLNPATGELIDTVPSLSVEETDAAVQFAAKAQKGWENESVVSRCAVISKFAELVERDKDVLAKTLSDETGKPI